MLGAGRQVIGNTGVFMHGVRQLFFVVIFDTNHEQRIVFEPLLNQVVILAAVFEFAIYSFVSGALGRIRYGQWNGEYNQVLRRIFLSVQAVKQILVRLCPDPPENKVVATYVE